MARPARARRPRPGSEGGTTLLELMVALAVLSILLVGLLLVWGRGLAVYLQGSETADLQQEARIAHGRMTNELRLAGMNPCNGTLTAGAVAGATSTSVDVEYFALSGASNLQKGTSDCATDGANVTHWRVTYAYDAGTQVLNRTQLNVDTTVSSGAQPLTGQKLGTVTFEYFKCDGTAAAVDTQPNRNLIAQVRVTVAASETFSASALTRELVSTVRLRNTACPGGI